MSSNKFTTIDGDQTRKKRNATRFFVGHSRNTKERHQRLTDYAKLKTDDDDVTVTLTDTDKTASIQQDDEKGEYLINIPTEAPVSNPYSEIDFEHFYSMLQKAWILHESGHYHYTDQPTVSQRFEQLQEKHDDKPRQVVGAIVQHGQRVWNAIEDGAIEEAIRNENGPNAAQRLAIKNESFIARNAKDAPEHGRKNITVDKGMHLAAMDLAKYDTGALRRLLDEDDDSYQFVDEEHKEFFLNEIFPLIEEATRAALTTPSSIKRQHIIWDYIEELVDKIVEFYGLDDIEQPDMEGMPGSDGSDADSDSGQAQSSKASGLGENSRQEIAQRQANTSQQTVQVQTDENPDEDGEDADASEENADGDMNGDSSEANAENGEETNGDTGQNGDSQQIGSGESTDGEVTCPNCGSEDTERQTQTVDGMVAARVNAPFNIDAPWVASIEFVKNDEVCGFRVTTSGTVPKQSIEQSGYKVVEVSTGVEILEPRSQYGETEPVEGFKCVECGTEWVPVIGGVSQ